jgi:type II secretory pathway component GspD/PulD (secretin)
MARRLSHLFCLISALGLMLAWAAPPGYARVYCNITEVTAKQLRNGVQITVKADGILSYPYYTGYSENRVEIRFSNARNETGKNFIDVSKFPVSHIELTTPQDAEEGVGVNIAVAMAEPSPVSWRMSSDRLTCTITVQSSRTLEGVEEEEEEKKKKEEEEKELSVEVTDGLVSVSAIKADLQEVLGKIAEETGANMTVDDAVKGEANLHLRDLPVDALLRSIASAFGLALSETDGVYMFSQGVPQDLAAYRLSGTSSFPLRYTRAKDASGLLPTFLYSYLHVNEEQNAVVVTAPKQMLDKIEADLQAVDIAPPQILIEFLAVEFTNTADLDKVIRMLRGDVTGRTTGYVEEDYFEPGYPEYWLESDSRAGALAYSSIGELPNDFEARIRALETAQQARIRAAPRMAVINGHPANIFIGVRRFIKVEYIMYNQTIEKIQGVDVGVKFRVTPLTGGGGEITLTIDPESTEISNISELDPKSGLPVLSTRQTGTTVRVKDGETVMIGGLTQRQTEERTTKIPLLGDLPLIGSLFRGRSRSTVSSDLVVFITPHILTPEGRLADEAKETEIRERFGVGETTG